MPPVRATGGASRFVPLATQATQSAADAAAAHPLAGAGANVRMGAGNRPYHMAAVPESTTPRAGGWLARTLNAVRGLFSNRGATGIVETRPAEFVANRVQPRSPSLIEEISARPHDPNGRVDFYTSYTTANGEVVNMERIGVTADANSGSCHAYFAFPADSTQRSIMVMGGRRTGQETAV